MESYGRQHEYLGMQLDYSHHGEVRITMVDYTKLILQDVPDNMKRGTAVTPAGNHLFRVNENDPEELGIEQKETFVHIIMQLLYLSQRVRPNIHTAVSFLCGQLNRPAIMQGDQVPSWDDGSSAKAERGRNKNRPMVDRCFICSARRYEGTYWQNVVIGTWVYLQHVDQAEVGGTEFHGK